MSCITKWKTYLNTDFKNHFKLISLSRSFGSLSLYWLYFLLTWLHIFPFSLYISYFKKLYAENFSLIVDCEISNTFYFVFCFLGRFIHPSYFHQSGLIDLTMSLFNLSLLQIRSYLSVDANPRYVMLPQKEWSHWYHLERDWVACIVSFSSSLDVILAESWNLSTEQKCKRFFCLLCLLLKFLQEWLGRFNELSSPLEFFDLFNTICCASHFFIKDFSGIFLISAKSCFLWWGCYSIQRYPK